MMLPSNRRQCNTLDHRACPEGRRQCYSMPSRLSARCSILLNLRKLLSFFSAIRFPRKRTARLSPAVQVREETPRGRAATAGGSHRVSYFANPKAPHIDEAQFSAHVSRATVRVAADQVGGTRTLCSRRNAPTTLIASATKRPCVCTSASPSRAVILRSNTIDVPLATSAQLNVRARNGVMFRFPCFRPKIAQFAAVRRPAGISTRDRPIGRTRASAANMTPVKASTIRSM
jgi:hypothetical protein